MCVCVGGGGGDTTKFHSLTLSLGKVVVVGGGGWLRKKGVAVLRKLGRIKFKGKQPQKSYAADLKMGHPY